ncbi:MAG: tRNA (N6-isopentenyl adenosine(37)-C2)-methylthiotransferase MiaB, partial [Candidatus Krumholzibacteriia bacterium]
VILGRLREAGFEPVDDHLAADLVLLNTCSVREHAEHKVISRVGELRHERAQAGRAPAVLGVCGCMAERMREELTQLRNRVDLVVGVDHYDELPHLVAAIMDPGTADRAQVAVGHDQSVHYVAPPALYPTNNSHLVTIHKGCDYKCTYCIVPYTRGPQVEKDPDLILAEIAGIVAAGGREVTLLGQNVTAYRWRGDLDFAALLRLVCQIDGLERIRFLTGHPRDMHPHLIATIADQPKVCPWLHVPAQSGSDRVLKRMKRFYTRADYLAMVRLARESLADVAFSGDFIVGFPGEADDDFEQTLSLVREVRYDTIFAFKYSERPGAPAARLADDVPVAEKKRRLAALLAVQDAVWADTAAAEVGRVVAAVVEEPARRPAGHWRLRTRNNRKLVVALPDAVAGEVRQVRITGWRNTSFLAEPVAG